MKSNVLIYGTSGKAIRELPAILLEFNVIGFIDSNPEKRGDTMFGRKIYHYTDLQHLSFDLVIICSMYSSDIEAHLLSSDVASFVNSNELTSVQRVASDLADLNEKYRFEQTRHIPKIALSASHIKSCKMITNRAKLLDLLPKNGVVAEMGVANGDFSLQILEYNKPNILHLIDTWGSGRYGAELKGNVDRVFSEEIQAGRVVVSRQSSQEAVSNFPNNYFDWIYIDTTHSYEQTKLELELYAPKIKAGGVIAGHDYAMGNWEKGYRYGVVEAVHEFCLSRDFKFVYLTMDLSEVQSFAIRSSS